ncbi:MAG: BON domain-containing protein [Anaerolineales bacterium]|nr:BON domain-containing protein [Anaerolineales bacterium]
MKTNSELQHDVQDEINCAPNITGGEIGVTAKDGVITLSGNVPLLKNTRLKKLLGVLLA